MATIGARKALENRERKQIVRYTDTDYQKEVIEGEGKMIKEIAEIKSVMKTMKKNQEFLEIVHKALYGTVGRQEVRRKEIMRFKGIKGKTEEETKEILEKRAAYLAKQKYAVLIEICRIFCLAGASKTKTKEKYAEEIVKFIEKPGETKHVVTEKDKVAHIEEEESEEEVVVKKPVTRAKKEEEKKKGKKAAKKETKKKEVKKETKKKEVKKTAGKKETKKGEVKKVKAPASKKGEEKKTKKAAPKKAAKK